MLFQMGFSQYFKGRQSYPDSKNGNKNDPNNYRPIAILSSFSKILDDISKINSIFGQDNILIPSQYGFQRNFSTIAITDIVTTYDNSFKRLYSF